MFIRLSTINDTNAIGDLMHECFGDRDEEDVLTCINGRYLLAFENNKLVAMTGLLWSEQYNGFEIDWTCTAVEYRCKGIMHELFKRLCTLTDEGIYCSCWRYDYDGTVNLQSLMDDFGFKEVLRPRVSYDTDYNCACGKYGYCVHQQVTNTVNGIEREHCSCYEDLYYRPATQEDYSV